MEQKEPIEFIFDGRKTIQAAGILVANDRVISRKRLLKLLYIADREALKEVGRPISGDRLVALPQGPVLSNFYNMMKKPDAEMSEFFQSSGIYLKLIKDPDVDELNRFEIKKLNEIAERFKDSDADDLSELTHTFPEWIKHNPGTSSETIPIEDILQAMDAADQIEFVRNNAKQSKGVEELWGK